MSNIKKRFLNGLEGGEVSTDKNGATRLYLRTMSFMEEADENGKTIGDKIKTGKLQAIDGAITSTVKADKATTFFASDKKTSIHSNTNTGKLDNDFIWDRLKIVHGIGEGEAFIEKEAPAGFWQGVVEIKHNNVPLFKMPLSGFKRELTPDGATYVYFDLNFPKYLKKAEDVTAEIKFLNAADEGSKVMLVLAGAEFIANGN